MNRKAFYDCIRPRLFADGLTHQQVDGFETLINEYERRGLGNPAWLAYIMATTFHETEATMRPIEEIGRGVKRPYGKPDPDTRQIYFGRGYVQLTWRKNYEVFSERYGLDLVNHPELALQPSVAVKILFDGMTEGLYTGVGLGRFIPDMGKGLPDFVRARAIVNGKDKASKIAGYAKIFLQGLLDADQAAQTPVPDAVVTTTDGETVEVFNPPSPQPDSAVFGVMPAPVPVEKVPWHSGIKTHVGMFVSAVLGVLAMIGYIPGMTPDQGADMLQTAFGVSGFREALPGLIKLAINYYAMRR